MTFMVTNVHPTGRTIGAGSYGSVEEVVIPGAICAAKGMQATFSLSVLTAMKR